MMAISLSDNYIPEMMTYAKQAQSAYLWMDHTAIDHILTIIWDSLPSLCSDFARTSMDETRMGIYEDKLTLLNRTLDDARRQFLPFSPQTTLHFSRMDTRIQQQPAGIIVGVTGRIQPAATVICDCMAAIRTRNPIILSFHPSAFSSSYAAASAIRDLAVSAGAPDNCIQWMEENTADALDNLLRSPDIAALMASGSREHIQKYLCAYHGPAAFLHPSSAFCYIHRSANIQKAVHLLILSRTFDNGLSTCSEQIILADRQVYAPFKEYLQNEGCYLATPEEITRLTAVLIDLSANTVNPAVIGQTPQTIAALADMTLPDDTRLIGIELDIDRAGHPLLIPFLCPVIVMMPAEHTENAAEKIEQLSHDETDFSSDPMLQEQPQLPQNHTLVIHSESPDTLRDLARILPAFTLVQGAPAAGQSLISQYMNPYGSHLDAGAFIQLLSHCRCQHRIPDVPHTFQLPAALYFQKGALGHLQFSSHQSQIVFLYGDGPSLHPQAHPVIRQIQQNYPALRYHYIHVPKDTPDGHSSDYLLPQLIEASPDCLIAIGDSQIMDTAKMLLTDYQAAYPSGSVHLILIPSINGCHTALLPFYNHYDQMSNTLSEHPVQREPYTIIADSHLHSLSENEEIYPACMAAMADAFDAYLSNNADDLTDAMAMQAICLFLIWMPKLLLSEHQEAVCMEHLQNACLLSGMAAAHTGIGLSRIMAGRLYCECRIPLPALQAIVLPHIIQYNGALHPAKYSWSAGAAGYHIPEKLNRLRQTAIQSFNDLHAVSEYASEHPLTEHSGTEHSGAEHSSSKHSGTKHLSGSDGAAAQLSFAVRDLIRESGMPLTIKACGIREKDYMQRIEAMARTTFEQLSTGNVDANPRYPLIKELTQLYKQIYK